jgi:hypothetical protein
MTSASPSSASSRAEWFLPAAIVAVLTAAATRVFPQMDDGYLLLILKERGPDAILAAHPDRPFVGAVWQLAAEGLGRSFWNAAYLAHAVAWILLGWLSARVWRRVQPGAEMFAPFVGALVVAPIAVRTQLSIVTISLLGVLSVIGALVTCLLALDYVETGRRALLGAALGTTIVGTMWSEYSVAATLVVATLIWGVEGRLERPRRRRAATAAAAVAAATVATYGLFATLARFERRPLADPRLLTERRGWIISLPFNLATRVWDVTFGDLLRTVGRFSVEWQSKTTLLEFVAGLLGAVAFVLVLRAGRKFVRSGEPVGPSWGGVRASLAAVFVGLVPIAAMRPAYRSDFASRFHLAVLPIAAGTTIAALLLAARPEYRATVVGVLGFIVGAAVTHFAADAARQHARLAGVSRAIRPLVPASGSPTLFVLSDPGLCYNGPVCTGAVTRDWPVNAESMVWIATREEAAIMLGPRTGCRDHAAMRASERGTTRPAFAPNPVYVEMENGAPELEPYCTERVGR